MRGTSASVLGALLLAAIPAPAAAEDNAPLQATQQELRQLQSTQKNKTGDSTAGGLKLSTPTLDVGSAERSAVQEWTTRQKQEQLQSEERKRREAGNWLVNGVEQLSKEETKPGTTKTTGEPADPTEADGLNATALDPSDPQYLLKLFDEQKKHSDPKDTAAKVRSTPAPDPFAPFLQGWLGTSPVRDQVMDQFKKGSEAGGLSGASGGSSTDFQPAAVVSSSGNRASLTEAAQQAKPNPYLVELNAPVPSRDMLAGSSAMSAAGQGLASGTTPAPAPLTTPLLDPLPDNRAPAKGPPPGLTDDKKYFPQQKKF
jgi:hypothetical protein